jgi:hypothetical protein
MPCFAVAALRRYNSAFGLLSLSQSGNVMGEVSGGTSSTVALPQDRLDSWKEIAAYLNRDVTTVQRWEKREGMPVHRHIHSRMGGRSTLFPQS